VTQCGDWKLEFGIGLKHDQRASINLKLQHIPTSIKLILACQ
jgi:hypothetical protein